MWLLYSGAFRDDEENCGGRSEVVPGWDGGCVEQACEAGGAGGGCWGAARFEEGCGGGLELGLGDEE